MNSLCLYYYIQDGVQPIHCAAQKGHEAVLKMLVEEFNIPPDAATHVGAVALSSKATATVFCVSQPYTVCVCVCVCVCVSLL